MEYTQCQQDRHVQHCVIRVSSKTASFEWASVWHTLALCFAFALCRPKLPRHTYLEKTQVPVHCPQCSAPEAVLHKSFGSHGRWLFILLLHSGLGSEQTFNDCVTSHHFGMRFCVYVWGLGGPWGFCVTGPAEVFLLWSAGYFWPLPPASQWFKAPRPASWLGFWGFWINDYTGWSAVLGHHAANNLTSLRNTWERKHKVMIKSTLAMTVLTRLFFRKKK